jgi:DNA polymerase III subunit gamma/tau
MAYEVTATRKRPQSFDELIGQDFVVSTLKSAVKAGRIAHAYLFSGPRGCGKTSAARILAKALNCANGPTDSPCGICPSCTEITKGNSLDVIEIDGASNTSVNDIRQIKDEVLFAPNKSRYKIYIIDEVHMLSNSAFNALLKTIEEPPPYIVFIFATTEIQKVPATIRSRCQQFTFRLVPIEKVKDVLARVSAESGIKAEDDALFWIARQATGSMRDSYTLFDQVVSFSEGNLTLDKIKEKLGLVGFDSMNNLADAFAEGNVQAALAQADRILQDGTSVDQCIVDLADYFRSLLLIKNGVSKESLIGYSIERFSKKALVALSSEQIEAGLALLLAAYRDIRYSMSQRYELELLVARMCGLKDLIAPADIFRRIIELKKELVSGGSRISPVAEAPARPISVQEEARTKGHDEDERGASPVPAKPPVRDEDAEEESEDVDAVVDESAQHPDLGLVKDIKKAVIADLKKTKVALASALENTEEWNLLGDVISIGFSSPYAESFVRQEVGFIAKRTAEVTGVHYKIELKLKMNGCEDSVEPEQNDSQVDVVKKMFRGTVVGNGAE